MKKKFAEELRELTGCSIVRNQSPVCPCAGNDPCIGTPDEILKLIEAGYIDHLDYGMMRMSVKEDLSPPVFVVVPKQVDDKCIFYQNGLCSLHHQNLSLAQQNITCISKLKDPDDHEDCPLLIFHILREWGIKRNRETLLKLALSFSNKVIQVIQKSNLN